MNQTTYAQSYEMSATPITVAPPMASPPGSATTTTTKYPPPPGQSPATSPNQLPNYQPQYPGYPVDPKQQLQQQQLQQLIATIPPEKLQALTQAVQAQQQQQHFAPPPQQAIATPPPAAPQAQRPHYVTSPPAGLFGSKTSSNHKHDHSKDAQQTGKVTRFLGDTLVGRFARASVQTASSAMKMPAALSPWGDNNPVTLPNVRYRDAILFTVFAGVGTPLVEGADGMVTDLFGADSFVSDIVSSGAGAITGSTILKYGVFQIVEQAIDKGILEHLLPEEEKLCQTHNVTSLQVGIKHKLLDVPADLRFSGVYPAADPQACPKGWFCPYLFASSRTPLVPRAADFAVATFFGPALAADYALAHHLLQHAPHVLALCDPDPAHDIACNRLLVLFTAISPYRGGMWSSSRRPGCGSLVFHVFDGCPAVVLPVSGKCPVAAWSPWTWTQMRAGGRQGYSAARQHGEVCEWLDEVVLLEKVDERVRGRYVDVLGRAVSLVVNGALGLEKCPPAVLGKVDPDRAGIVMLRY